MKAFLSISLGGLLLSGLLASCAPTISPVVGRIVNMQTGEEGTISFTRGTLRPRAGDPYAPDNTLIRIGGKTLSGRTKIIELPSGSAPANWGMQLELGGSKQGGVVGLGWGVGLNRTPGEPQRVGNLIARSSGPKPMTLTCELRVDSDEHGLGECTSNSGTRYALQF